MPLNQGYRFAKTLGVDAIGHTVLSYLAGHFTHSSAAEWSERIRCGEVELYRKGAQANGTVAAETPVECADILIWNRPPWQEPAVPTEFSVRFQDDHLLVVDKPSGLPTIPGGGYFENTLVHLVRNSFPDAKPMHRLGRATSGLVLFSLDSPTASKLQSVWPEIRKHYHAIACGIAENDEYDIRVSIGPVSHPKLGTIHAALPTGKTARSFARVIGHRNGNTDFEVELGTGRAHQIRIHLASIGHPLVGDPVYQAGGIPRSDHPGLPGDGGYSLHAARMILTHPVTHATLTFETPAPFPFGSDAERFTGGNRRKR